MKNTFYFWLFVKLLLSFSIYASLAVSFEIQLDRRMELGISEMMYPGSVLYSNSTNKPDHFDATFITKTEINQVKQHYGNMGFIFYDCSPNNDGSNFGSGALEHDQFHKTVQVGHGEGLTYIQMGVFDNKKSTIDVICSMVTFW